jgi:hypothetical protein
MKIIGLLLMLSFGFSAQSHAQSNLDNISSAPVFVYKTKGNYNNLVPVLLSDDRKQIISYPHPKDLMAGKNFLLPVQLHKQYLLDRKGIGSNVAFLNYTYTEYAKFINAPPLKELFAHIRDADPLLLLCHCPQPKGHPMEVKLLNKLIDANKLQVSCKIIK